ncbi:MAG: hypothetical protein HY074_02835 [Deltaproteobacteria bacterium]|nr:hypothetical protein [Deltaproteobacteria bacterium]
MANVDPPPEQQLTKSVPEVSNAPLDPALVYEANAELIFQSIRYFLPEAVTAETIEAVAQEIFSDIPNSGYQKYARLLCLKSVYRHVLAHPRAKVPRDFSPPNIDSTSEPTLAQAFCLLLRDRFELSCFELAAIVDASEGSVRTRLERTRARLYPESAAARTGNAPGSSHVCIKTRELIEDWNITSARLGQFTVPGSLSRAVGDCPRCEVSLKQRLTSLEHLREIHLHPLPEPLAAFPVSPLFVKEGKRMLLNWSAAPWYVKALFEGLLATTLVLGIVLSIPRIKGIYEFWLERRLDLYSIAELAAGLSGSRSEVTNDAAVTAAGSGEAGATGSKATTASGAAGATPVATAQPERANSIQETEFLGRDSAIPTSEKLYRVLIKTDSPEAIKDQVLRALTGVHYTVADDETAVGAELPGGVMFDVLVPLKNYKQIENELSRMGEMKIIITRAKERGAPGKAHLKIWLQRI